MKICAHGAQYADLTTGVTDTRECHFVGVCALIGQNQKTCKTP